jgi:hypothetical protein
MEKEFIPPDEVLALRGLGFDEPCFMYYGEKNILRIFTIDIKDLITNSELPPQYNACPTFSQAFRWFRDMYGMCSFIKPENNEEDVIVWEYVILTVSGWEVVFTIRKSNHNLFEEAELECLKKLIEIVKEKQHNK